MAADRAGARSCTHKRELGQRRGADVGFTANNGRKSAHLGTSARSHNRTSSGASEVQNRVYGKPPLKQPIRPQEYCGTGTGAKDVRKSGRFHTLSSSSIQIGFTGEGVCCFTLWTFVGEPSAPQAPGFHSATSHSASAICSRESRNAAFVTRLPVPIPARARRPRSPRCPPPHAGGN